MILGEDQDLPRGIERENKIIQTILRQLLFALDGLHSTGIVHRDIKPQNVIFSEGSSHCPILSVTQSDFQISWALLWSRFSYVQDHWSRGCSGSESWNQLYTEGVSFGPEVSSFPLRNLVSLSTWSWPRHTSLFATRSYCIYNQFQVTNLLTPLDSLTHEKNEKHTFAYGHSYHFLAYILSLFGFRPVRILSGSDKC